MSKKAWRIVLTGKKDKTMVSVHKLPDERTARSTGKRYSQLTHRFTVALESRTSPGEWVQESL